MHDIYLKFQEIFNFYERKIEKPPLQRVRFHRYQKNSNIIKGFYTSCIFLWQKKMQPTGKTW